jgi:hypothetical protein
VIVFCGLQQLGCGVLFDFCKTFRITFLDSSGTHPCIACRKKYGFAEVELTLSFSQMKRSFAGEETRPSKETRRNPPRQAKGLGSLNEEMLEAGAASLLEDVPVPATRSFTAGELTFEAAEYEHTRLRYWSESASAPDVVLRQLRHEYCVESRTRNISDVKRSNIAARDFEKERYDKASKKARRSEILAKARAARRVHSSV